MSHPSEGRRSPAGAAGAGLPGARDEISAASVEGAEARGPLDPELLELPDPPRAERTRTLALLLVTAAASLAMVFSLARDGAFALSDAEPIEAGELLGIKTAAIGQNRLVNAHGLLGTRGAIRYERPFESDSYRLMPAAGRSDLWVELRVPAGQEGERFVPPPSFSGRLVRFDGTGPRHRALRAYVPAGAWLLVDGETRERARWSLALCALFTGFAAWNLAMFARLVRRVR